MITAPQTELRAPGVGVAVIVWKDRSRTQLLLGLGHGPAERESIYAVPGGHWESGESLVGAIRRETMEEAGVELDEPTLFSIYEFFRPDKQKSYVTIGFEGFLPDEQVPHVVELENKSNWGWFTPEEALQLNLFQPDRVLIERAVSRVLYDSE